MVIPEHYLAHDQVPKNILAGAFVMKLSRNRITLMRWISEFNFRSSERTTDLKRRYLYTYSFPIHEANIPQRVKRQAACDKHSFRRILREIFLSERIREMKTCFQIGRSTYLAESIIMQRLKEIKSSTAPFCLM